MGSGYTTLDPSRRKFPLPIHSNDEAPTELEADVDEGSANPGSCRAQARGISDECIVTSGGKNS